MAIPVTVPSSPPAGAGSPASSDASTTPQTPTTPSNPQTLALPPPSDSASAASAVAVSLSNGSAISAAKRKPSRRANTAERRANHNAVERARRETLNGRFLDLAALLPNLSQIRRPSKSSIVNSSIAHIHASRRHRLIAARELRLLKAEADALRRELNEWRDRSGLPRVDEPVRGEAFEMILRGEVEILSAGPIEEEDGNGDYAGDDFGDDDFAAHPGTHGPEDTPIDEIRGPMTHAAVALLKTNSDVSPFAHSTPNAGMHLPALLPRQGGHGAANPMVVQNPAAVSFENPAMVSMYEPHHPGANQFFGAHGNVMGNSNADEKPNWHGPMYSSLPNPAPGQPSFTPPATSQGHASAAYYMSMQRQAMLQQQRGMGHMYGSPEGDDAPSMGSAPGSGARRERSGSMGSTGSGYASPGTSSSYEMTNNMPQRRMSVANGPAFSEGMGMGMGGMGIPMMKSAPIAVGGGGNGHGYASMML